MRIGKNDARIGQNDAAEQAEDELTRRRRENEILRRQTPRKNGNT